MLKNNLVTKRYLYSSQKSPDAVYIQYVTGTLQDHHDFCLKAADDVNILKMTSEYVSEVDVKQVGIVAVVKRSVDDLSYIENSGSSIELLKDKPLKGKKEEVKK